MGDDNRDSFLAVWWPVFMGGLAGPFLAPLLRKWLAPHFAASLAFFLVYLGIGLLFLRRPPSESWRFGRWMAAGAAGSVIAGALTYWLA